MIELNLSVNREKLQKDDLEQLEEAKNMNDYIMHARSGWTKKNHKYISRTKKNGKWYYVYKNGKKYNKFQDWLGVDERDEYRRLDDEYNNKYKNSEWALWERVNPNKPITTGPIPDGYAQWKPKEVDAWNRRAEAIKKYKNTPLYKIENTTAKAKSFVKKLFNKKVSNNVKAYNGKR